MNSIDEHLRRWTEAANGRQVDVNTSGETSLERAQRLYVEEKIPLEVLESRLERIFKRRDSHEHRD